MKSLDIGCWKHFKKKHGKETVKWIEEQAEVQGVILESDTEIFFCFQKREEKMIYFGRDAIEETICHIGNLNNCRLKGIFRENGHFNIWAGMQS